MDHVVLLVEDDDDLRDSLREVLGHAGYALLSAANGTHALALVRTWSPRLVLLDWRLGCSPTGSALVELLRHHCGAIVVMSADQASAEEARRAGVATFLHKPFAISHLLSTIASAIRDDVSVR
jgi:DNA-binding response OmpR family regulator